MIEKHARDVWLDEVGIRAGSAAKFPHYAKVQARLRSFATCTRKLKAESLSEAGFFYHGQSYCIIFYFFSLWSIGKNLIFAGSDDCTICFHCGGGLREWKESEDPWIEHAYWFPRCGFVLSVKGKDYVDQSWGKKQDSSSSEVIALDVIDWDVYVCIYHLFIFVDNYVEM